MGQRQFGSGRLTRRHFVAAALGGLAAGNGTGRQAAAQQARHPYYSDLDALDASLADTGLWWPNRHMLLKLARPATMLTSTAVADEEIPVGHGKIGGDPDLPKDTQWPMRAPSKEGMQDVRVMRRLAASNKQLRLGPETALKQDLAARDAPLAFLMQIDLAACAAAGPMDPDIPRHGRLLIFYDLVFGPWFAEQEEGKALRLIYLPDETAPLERRPVPDLGLGLWGVTQKDFLGGGNDPRLFQRLSAARIDPHFTYTLPDNGAYDMLVRYGYPRTVPHGDWLEKQVWSAGDGCQLYGWPSFVQSDPGIELGVADSGYGKPTSADYMNVITGLSRYIREWIPLVSISGYDSNSTDFNGAYYVMIRRTDLKKRDFAKAVIVYQTD